MGTTSIVAVFLLFLTVGQGEQFVTKPINGYSGLYFEETSKIYFYSSKWKVVTNVNLTKYRTELNDNKNIVETIVNSCEELKSIETAKNASNKGGEVCGPILYQLSGLMADIETNDNSWFGRDNRFKRSIVSELFEEDWPEDQLTFSDEFRNMSALGITTRTYTEKQTSYISSTINSGGRLDQRNSQAINDYVASQMLFVSNTLSAARNGSVNVMRLYQLRTTVQDIISYHMLILNRFLSKQKQYLNIVKLVGKRNSEIPNILPSDLLMKELNNIRSIVGENGFDLPTKISAENLLFLYHISLSEIIRIDDQIFSIFKVPLISKYAGSHFSLVKVTSSLFNVKDDLYSFVLPNHEFIAIDAFKERYTTLTLEDLNDCHQIKNNSSMICELNSAVMSIMASSECEINTLIRSDFPMKSTICNDRFIRNNAEIFIKVLKPNSWLVSMPKPSRIRYICEGVVTKEFITQINGLLTIDPNCKFATDNVLITGHNFFPKTIINEGLISKYSKKFEQIRELSERVSSNDNFLTNNIPLVINFGEKDKLLSISYSASDVNDKLQLEDLHYNIRNVDVRTHALVGLIVSILAAAIFIFVTKTMKSNKPSAPTLRTIS